MVKVFKVLIINPFNKLEEIITMSAKNNKELKRKLEVRNYKIKEIIGEM
jgi:hypothetical protein